MGRIDAALARCDRAIARPIIEWLKARLSPLEDQSLDRYAVPPSLALADPEATAALVEVIPDLKEQGIGQSRDIALRIVAGDLSELQSRFWTIIRQAAFDLHIVDREDRAGVRRVEVEVLPAMPVRLPPAPDHRRCVEVLATTTREGPRSPNHRILFLQPPTRFRVIGSWQAAEESRPIGLEIL